MAAADVQAPPAEPAPALPDYVTSPNAVFADEGVEWRYGKAPDYSKTRKVWEEGKKMNHAAGSLPQLVENLVKNWEVEASFKPRLQDWRTIDHANYSFAMNGGPGQGAEHMLKVGTYNAIVAPNEYYSPENSDFASSHKTFKRMMPTFAWEVIEVYSGPPKVALKWRHWGVMKNDYVGFNDKGEKVVAKAHGGPIEIFGITTATVDDKLRLQALDTYFDPLDMFRQIAPYGVVTKEKMNRNVDFSAAMDVGANHTPEQQATDGAKKPADFSNDGVKIAEHFGKPQQDNEKDVQAPEAVIQKHISESTGKPADEFVPHQGADTEKSAAASAPTELSAAQQAVEAAATHGANAEIEKPASNYHEAKKDTAPQGISTDVPRSMYSSSVTGNLEDRVRMGRTGDFQDESRHIRDAVDEHLEGPSDKVHPHPHDTEQAVQPQPGEAVAVPAQSEETRVTHEEMSNITAAECPFLMNRE
ncbi:hypothetical protein BAUCODRAFT_555502 [Baudoinia panamericana UAMH 10762]|uniref:Pathogen-related protein n=1 Tax=Baudoinia panamericana (strain UAMH 10762) TaxID=717646 RepID=M2N7A2_BAUPA|nr:uncharacterized protein BAUCODRAFT_555502 [Baudoinia panamericana UAMH 10762]EMC94675.1 hypothetical protein BAUCODRAFT_555502 [Baudoinia panamericana UAMH 10762]